MLSDLFCVFALRLYIDVEIIWLYKYLKLFEAQNIQNTKPSFSCDSLAAMISNSFDLDVCFLGKVLVWLGAYARSVVYWTGKCCICIIPYSFYVAHDIAAQILRVFGKFVKAFLQKSGFYFLYSYSVDVGFYVLGAWIAMSNNFFCWISYFIQCFTLLCSGQHVYVAAFLSSLAQHFLAGLQSGALLVCDVGKAFDRC